MNLGKAEIIPFSPVVVDSVGTWTITYTVGATGIAEYGGVQIYIPVGWTIPQFNNPAEAGYVQISIKSREKAEFKQSIYSGRWIGVELVCGQLKRGDTINIVYGDRSQGGPGSYAPRVPVPRSEFTTSVDTQGYFIYQKLVNSPELGVTAGEPVGFHVTVPALVGDGQEVKVGITSVDSVGNWVDNFQGKVRILSELKTGKSGVQELPLVECKVVNGLANFNIIKGHSGFKRLKVMEVNGSRSGQSNPCKDRDDIQGYQVFFGDIHGHSNYSDGRFSPTQYYEYARDISRLDFCSLSDHDNVGSNSNVEEHSKLLDEDSWKELKQIANFFDQPGSFTTLIGYEYTNTEIEVGGHRNLYFISDDPPLFRSWDKETNNPTKLFAVLHQLGQPVLVVPHHPLHFMGWEHDPEFQRLFEIYSMWGSSETDEDDCAFRHPIKYHHGGFSYQRALARGYRLGVIAGGDNHDSLPGLKHATDIWRKGRMSKPPGLIGVYAVENTRQAIFDALWHRRCYGTTGNRILLDFRLNGALMGAELRGEAERRIEVTAYGEGPLDYVVIVKNGEEVFQRPVDGWEIQFNWIDKASNNKNDYYYVKVRQKDGSRAWSSPIWVENL